MKLLLFLLGIVLCHGLPSLGGYQSIDITEAKSSSTINTLISTGLEKIVDDGLQKGDFSSTNFALTKINSISRQVTDDKENYKFNCQFDNDEDVTLVASFEVHYKSSTSVSTSTSTSHSTTSSSTTTVATFSYKATKRTAAQSVETSYKVFTSSEIQYSKEIQNVLDYGVDQVIKTSIERGTLSNLTFTLQSVNSVSRQIAGSALFYKCDVNLQGEGDIIVESVFTVYYQPILASTSMVDYSCKVKQQEKEDQFTVTTEIIGPDQDQYTPVPVGDVKNDDTTQSAVEFGCDQVNMIAIQEKKIPDLTLELEEVLEAYSQVVGNGLFYKFTCKLGDRKSVNITTTFTVHYQITTEERSLTEYSYETQYIEANSNDTFPTIPTEGETEVTEPVNNDDSVGETYPWDTVEEEYLLGEQESIEEESLPWGSEEEDGEWNTETFIPLPVEETAETEVELPVVTPEEETIVEILPVEEEAVLVEEEEQNEEEEENEADAIANVVFQFGVNTILRQGIRDKKIPKDSFAVSNIESFTRSDGNAGSLYKFSCEAKNQNKSTLVGMDFAVYYQTNSTRKILSSYSYSINIDEGVTSNSSVVPIDGEYNLCEEEEIKTDAVIKGVLEYGASQIYITALVEGKVAVSEFNISSVVSVWKQVTVNGAYYRCEVVLENTKNVTIKTNFTISYQSATKQMTISEYKYTVDENGASGDDNVSTTVIVNSTNTSDSSSTSSDTNDESYVELQFPEIQGSNEVQDVLNYGVNLVIQKGYEKNKIPRSQYEITKIVSVLKKVGFNGKNYYKCSVQLQDIAKVKIMAQFTVSIKTSTHTKYLSSWSYNVSNIRTLSVLPDNAYIQVNVSEVEYNSEIQDCLDFGIEEILHDSEQYSVTEINSVYRQVVESALYYKFDVSLSNGNDKTVKLTFTVYYKPDIDLKDVKAYSYKITTISTSTTASTSNSYTQMDVDEVKTSTKYQDILDYGAKECVRKLTENKVVVSSDFEVSEVLSAYTQSTSNGENCKLRARLTNPVGIYLDVNLNVKYQPETETKTLTSYSVEGSNAGQGDVMIADYTSDDKGENLGVGNCQKVVNEEVDASSEVQGAINYGLDAIVPDIVKSEEIDTDDFEVKEVKNVYREVVDNQNYRVEATLENSKGKKIDCSFKVNYQSSSDTKEVVSYSYITY